MTDVNELRVKRESPLSGARDAFSELRQSVLERLRSDLGSQLESAPAEVLRAATEQRFEQVLAAESVTLKPEEKRRLFEQVVEELLGYGPLERYLKMDGVTEIMVNGPHQIFVARGGKLEPVAARFRDQDHLLAVIDRLVAPLGQKLSAAVQMIDGRLPDGSRVNVVMPPAASQGPAVTITLPARKEYTVAELISAGALTKAAAEFLQACVFARLNVLISGGVSAGKSALLGALAGEIAGHERIVAVEKSPELRIEQAHVVRLAAEPGQTPSVADLLRNALRMRPDRILIGELEPGVALAYLHIVNSGFEGSMSTIQADSPPQAVGQLETWARGEAPVLSAARVRGDIVRGLDVLVHMVQVRDNSRRVAAIQEVVAGKDGALRLSGIFHLQPPLSKEPSASRLQATGLRPQLMSRLQEAGITLSPSVLRNGD